MNKIETQEWVTMQQGAGGGFGTKSGSVAAKKSSLNVQAGRAKRIQAGKPLTKDVRFAQADSRERGKLMGAALQRQKAAKFGSVTKSGLDDLLSPAQADKVSNRQRLRNRFETMKMGKELASA